MRVTGKHTTRTVRLDGRRLSPKPSQRVWNHSPDGFAWGYGGSGPAQLALALLLAVGVPPKRAVQLHQVLKAELVAGLPQADFDVEFDMDAWLLRQAGTQLAG